MADDWTPDWRLLAPHRPLSPGDAAYVDRPVGGGGAIAQWVASGGSTVLINGPTGVGKSTELAHAAQELSATRLPCLVQVDRKANMHRVSADELMRLIADEILTLARETWKLRVSDKLSTFETSGVQTARLAILEVERLSTPGRLALLLDGLEKLPPGAGTREIFDALAQLPESIDLIVIIPWHAAFGGGTEAILRPGEHMHRIFALDTALATQQPTKATTSFFGALIARRLRSTDPLPPSFDAQMLGALLTSGGIPRVFLQLLADAGTYARLKRSAAWPDVSDLVEAVTDQQQSFIRALLPGDTQAIQEAIGTDGRELDLERRVRLLAQGILLERIVNKKIQLEAHPLVAHAIKSRHA